jgi:hypothetical protein
MQRTEQAAGATLRRAAVAPLWRLAAVTHWPALLAAAVTVVLAMPTLNYVYGPDQALFAYFGNRLAHGAGLYVDVWDVKPPGIFWIYALITRIPGPEFQVLRAADLVYTAAAVIAIYAVGTAYWGRLAGGVAAALYGAVYVTATGYWHSAQPDSFMVLPLMLALLSYERGRIRGGRVWPFASGIFFGLCTQLRPVVVLVAAMLAALDLAESRASPAGRGMDIRSGAALRVGLLIAGGLAVELATLLWLLPFGAVGEYFYTQLVYAGTYSRQGGPYSPEGLTLGNYLSGLRSGTMFIVFARMVLVAPALAAVVIGVVIRGERRVRDVALLSLAAYIGVAVQAKFFLYHWHLLLPFLALLSGWTAAFLWRTLRTAGRTPLAAGATLTALGALLLLLTPNVTDRAVREWVDAVRFVVHPDSRSAYYDRFGLWGRGSFSYRASEEVSAYLRAHTADGDTLFVWGYDPLIYVLSGRDSPSRFVSFLGLMSTWTPPRWQDEFVDDLTAHRPRYVIAQRGENARWITGHDIDAVDFIPLIPRFRALLDRDYVVERVIEDYTLYRLR